MAQLHGGKDVQALLLTSKAPPHNYTNTVHEGGLDQTMCHAALTHNTLAMGISKLLTA